MRQLLSSFAGLVVIGIIVLAINLIGSMMLGRIKVDLTEEKLFTLDAGSINILGALEDEISAKLYYSKTAIREIPQLKMYADRVRAMLKEYEALSKGKLKIELIDPRPDTEDEEWAQTYGLRAFPSQRGENLYLGLVLRDESDNEQVIPFFDPNREASLEYDISLALYLIGNPERKTVGVMSALPVMGGPAAFNPMMPQQANQPPWALFQLLQRSYAMQTINMLNPVISPELDLLLVVHPKDLSLAAQYALDQYVLGGGRLLLFLDPFCEVDQAAMAGMMDLNMRFQASFASDMPVLLNSWGLALKNEQGGAAMFPGGGMQVVADRKLAYKLPAQAGGMDMLIWLVLTGENCQKQEIITSALENMLLASAGALEKIGDNDQVQITPLLTTSNEASTINDIVLKIGIDPGQLAQEYQPGAEELMLACKITGQFQTAFPTGPPPNQTPDGLEMPASSGPQLRESKAPTTIIVVADVDMLADRYAVTNNFFGQQLANDNYNFLANAVENLTGSQDLISLRSRGRSQRPFTTIKKIELAAQEQWQAEEDELQAKVDQANRELDELQRGDNDLQALNKEYVNQMRGIREERTKMIGELREIRRNLREDVENKIARLKFYNIALVPFLVAVLGLVVYSARKLRRRVTT